MGGAKGPFAIPVSYSPLSGVHVRTLRPKEDQPGITQIWPSRAGLGTHISSLLALSILFFSLLLLSSSPRRGVRIGGNM